MPSRRDVLIGAATAGAAVLLRPVLPAFAKASASAGVKLTPVNFKVPEGACDCHVHIIGDQKRFPLSPARTYTPEPAAAGKLRAVHRALHISRVVVVQVSIYGTDNACLLDAMKQFGARARGVAVIDDKTPESALDAMQRAGIRGVRLIFPPAFADLVAARERFTDAVERVKKRNWHIEIYAMPIMIDGLREQIMAAPVPVVLDHFGGAQASFGVEQPGFDGILKLVQSGKAYMKISGAYRSSTQAPDYADVAPLAKALIAANPQRILWGTDWPHVDSVPVPGRKPTDVAPMLPIDDGRVFNLLATWAPDAAVRKTILVENPARLYGF